MVNATGIEPALANKTARMIWAIMTRGEAYREPALKAA